MQRPEVLATPHTEAKVDDDRQVAGVSFFLLALLAFIIALSALLVPLLRPGEVGLGSYSYRIADDQAPVLYRLPYLDGEPWFFSPYDPPKISLFTFSPISINKADQDLLMTLPGVGPVLAARIVQHRDEQKGFSSIDELMQVRGIGVKTLERLRPLLVL